MRTESGELWMDGEGTLMVSIDPIGERWFVFGVQSPIRADHPLIVQPLTKVAGTDGVFLVDRLCYPNGSAFRS